MGDQERTDEYKWIDQLIVGNFMAQQYCKPMEKKHKALQKERSHIRKKELNYNKLTFCSLLNKLKVELYEYEVPMQGSILPVNKKLNK